MFPREPATRRKSPVALPSCGETGTVAAAG
jgi:hypothetical protein